MTEKMTPARMDLIERCLKDRRLVPRDRVREMAAEIRRCWAEKKWLLKTLSEIGCPATVYDIDCHRTDCSDGDDQCWVDKMVKEVS